MRKIFQLCVCALAMVFYSVEGHCQLPLLIPNTLEGEEINLAIQSGTFDFFDGFATNTLGINQAYLGPVVMLNSGDSVQFNVLNMLMEMSSLHWHGLHIPADKDGGPHQMIDMMETWSPKFKIRDRAATYWFHPHGHLSTLKQATLGAAGLIIVRDDEEAALNLPRTYGVDDFPIIITSVHFNAAKQIEWVNSDINTAMVNGRVEGFLDVPAQVIRLRILDASNHLSHAIGFSNGMSFSVIGSEASLLENAVSLSELKISAGERYEILVDLSGHEGETINVMSYGTHLPMGWPGGDMMGMNSVTSLDNIDYSLFELHVGQPSAEPVTAIPTSLVSYDPWDTTNANTRPFVLTGDGVSVLNFAINGASFNMDVINETVMLDEIEIWEITNNSAMGHPFHVHGNSFYVIEWNGETIPDEMKCKKDVVMIPPMGSAKIAIKFEDYADPEFPFMYHCHILSHEDFGGMMGQYIVVDDVAVTENHNNGISIYPNPSEANSDMQIMIPDEEDFQFLEIMDISGQLVYSEKIKAKIFSIKAPVVAGFYIVRLVGLKTNKSCTLIIK